MANASNYLEPALLNHLLKKGTVDFTSPTALYIGLWTANPSPGASGTEVSGNNYARMTVAFNTASSGTTTNDGAITFLPATGGDWGDIAFVGLYDALTTGNLLVWSALAVTKTVSDGDTFVIADDNLTINLA
tara:strand:- start:584 stop:979 length:396 start_codon:yes stop_codon:yes gene_type:complete